MQQTTKYQFKLIEGSDDFSPQPLNDNVEKVEELISGVEAAYTPDNKPYVAGSYTGNGSAVTVTLGFKPSFLVITGRISTYPVGQDSLGSYDAFTAGSILTTIVTLTDTGFIARTTADNVYPQLANSGRTYDYIAFR